MDEEEMNDYHLLKIDVLWSRVLLSIIDFFNFVNVHMTQFCQIEFSQKIYISENSLGMRILIDVESENLKNLFL